MNKILENLLQNPPKAVFLDLDNTLYAYESSHKPAMEEVYSKLQSMYPLNKETLQNAFSQAQKEVKTQLKNTASSHSRLLYFQKMIEILGMNTQCLLSLDLEQTYWRAFLRNAKLFEGVKSFLYELRSMHIKTVIVTDLTTQIQLRKLIHFEIDNLIDFVVTSEEAGIEKPHEDIFNLALRKVDSKPEEVWMIGDSYEKDILGAEKLGILAIQKVEKSQKLYTAVKYNFTNFT